MVQGNGRHKRRYTTQTKSSPALSVLMGVAAEISPLPPCDAGLLGSLPAAAPVDWDAGGNVGDARRTRSPKTKMTGHSLVHFKKVVMVTNSCWIL